MTAQEVRFTDPEVRDVLGDFLDGSQSWKRFFAAAEALSALDADSLVDMQAALVEAVVAGRYGGVPRTREPTTFLDEDGSLPGGIAFGRVVSHDDDLASALANIDDLRAAKGERGVRRRIRSIAADESTGFLGDLLLMRLLPRAYRLRTGAAMPGYGAYEREEDRAPGARDGTRTAILEVEHDGVPGLVAVEELNASDFQFEDGLQRDITTLRRFVPFTVRTTHRGEALSSSEHRDWRAARDGVVLFRGPVDAPPPDEAWVAASRAAMLKPPGKRRALPVADVWAAIETAGPGDPVLLAEALATVLVAWTPARIRAFDAGLRSLLAQLDRPDVLAAATEVFGWLSDDAWEDVRLGVVAQGRAAHTAALEEPAAFDWATVEPGELVLGAASDAHEALTDERIEDDDDDESSGAWTGAVVLSRRAGELCLRWWADGASARERHAAAEGPGSTVLAVRPELDRARLRDAVWFIQPGPLL